MSQRARRGRGAPPRTAAVAAAFAAVAAALALLASGCAAFGAASATPGTAPPSASPPGGRPSSSQSRAAASRSPSAVPGSRGTASGKPLAGKIVGIDPGHNGLNYTDPAFLDHKIWNGREWENCNTTGTQTAAGYSEALFTFNVAMFLAADLRRAGARVVLTRHNNHGVGPCVDWRSYVLNRAHADIAIDIHADGGPTWGRGFTVLEPVADKINAKVVAPSLRFGRYVHAAFIADTPFRPADYYGHDGYMPRDDLAGLNLATQPKVLVECGNMPNPADAALLTSPRVQREIARALEAAIIRFLTGRWPPGTGG